MEVNFPALLVAAVFAVALHWIWFHPRVIGMLYFRASGQTTDSMPRQASAKQFALMLLSALFIAFTLQFLVIHQYGALGMIGGDTTRAEPSFMAFMSDYGQAYRTVKHGMLHGFMTGLFFAFPIVGIGALQENRNFTYTLITGGYWTIACMIMGGIVCGWQ